MSRAMTQKKFTESIKNAKTQKEIIEVYKELNSAWKQKYDRQSKLFASLKFKVYGKYKLYQIMNLESGDSIEIDDEHYDVRGSVFLTNRIEIRLGHEGTVYFLIIKNEEKLFFKKGYDGEEEPFKRPRITYMDTWDEEQQ